jgi:OOP family OmpA-OmpF porin
MNPLGLKQHELTTPRIHRNLSPVSEYMIRHMRNIQYLAMLSLVVVVLSDARVVAQTVKLEGLIKARDGANIVLHTSNSTDVIVELDDDTQVGQVQGVFKARRKQMSMAALIPGLAIKVEGTYGGHNHLAAKSISFTGDDLKQARSVQAGLHETKLQTEENKQRLAAAQKEIEENRKNVEENQKRIAENRASIDEAIARFGQLDDYYIFDELTVYFPSGKTKVDPKYDSQLLALAERAKAVNGYMIEVTGYASSSGSVALNQRLSEDRANNVTTILIQRGRIPLTRMLAPGAMGESDQVDSGTKADAEAENRRVRVRVLQNKAIAGI